MGSATFVNGVERLLRSDPAHAVGADYFDVDPDLLGTPNGVVSLPTGDLRAPRPDHRITKATRTPPADHADCPRWRQFLAEATGGDDELIGFLQRFMGYSLSGHATEHTLVFVHGPGGNGKTVFVHTWGWILGDYARTAPMEALTETRGDRHPTELAHIVGARLVAATETEHNHAWAESRLKQLTGGDTITTRFMYRDFFEYRPTFKICVVRNNPPTLRSTDEAMRRRLRIVPFLNRPEHPDPDLETTLRCEAAAILRWMIDGYQWWASDGLGTAACIDAATAEYFSENDHITTWLESETVINPACTTSDKDLYAAWTSYANAAGIDRRNATWFGRRLQAQGHTKTKTATGIRWQGITLRDRNPPDPRDT